MARDGSGTYSLPGATFPYIDGEIIQASELNNNLSDIGAALTQSLSKDGQTSLTANLNFNGNQATNLAVANANGKAVRYQDTRETSPLNITSSGSKVLPSYEGTLIRITTAGVYNITGFSSTGSTGKILTFLIVNTGITFVHGSFFQLKNGVNRTFFGGETIQMIEITAGTWVEIGTQKQLDMSSYSGVDISLDIGQSAKYIFTSIASLALRLAVSTGQAYRILLMFTDMAAMVGSGTVCALYPNNVVLPSNTNRESIFGSQNTANGTITAQNYLQLGGASTQRMIEATINIGVNTQNVHAHFSEASTTANNAGFIGSTSNITLPWTSLGTINFNTQSGTCLIERIM